MLEMLNFMKAATGTDPTDSAAVEGKKTSPDEPRSNSGDDSNSNPSSDHDEESQGEEIKSDANRGADSAFEEEGEGDTGVEIAYDLKGDESGVEISTPPVPIPEDQRSIADESNHSDMDSDKITTLDMVGTVTLLSTAIAFVLATILFHPIVVENLSTDAGIEEPYFFWMAASVFNLMFASINVIRRRNNGLVEIVMSSIGLIGGILWLGASIFLFRFAGETRNTFCILFFIGCILNLLTIAYDMTMLFKSGTNLVFVWLTLLSAFAANVIFAIGMVDLMLNLGKDPLPSDHHNSYLILILGSVMYFLLALFYSIAIVRKGKDTQAIQNKIGRASCRERV